MSENLNPPNARQMSAIDDVLAAAATDRRHVEAFERDEQLKLVHRVQSVLEPIKDRMTSAGYASRIRPDSTSVTLYMAEPHPAIPNEYATFTVTVNAITRSVSGSGTNSGKSLRMRGFDIPAEELDTDRIVTEVTNWIRAVLTPRNIVAAGGADTNGAGYV